MYMHATNLCKSVALAAEGDQYLSSLVGVKLEIWVDGAPDSDHHLAYIASDYSVVVLDNDDTGGTDVFYSVYGQLSTPDTLWATLPPLPPPSGEPN